MLQKILVTIILILSVGYVVYKVATAIRDKGRMDCGCGAGECCPNRKRKRH